MPSCKPATSKHGLFSLVNVDTVLLCEVIKIVSGYLNQ